MSTSNNESQLRWVNISDRDHGVRFRAWDDSHGFPVRAGLIRRNTDGSWSAYVHGVRPAPTFDTHLEAQASVEETYTTGRTSTILYQYTVEQEERIQDCLVHVAILTGQDVLDIAFAHQEDVISHLVWFTHLTGEAVGIPALDRRMRGSWGWPDETPGDDFRSYCIVRGI